MIVLVCVNNVVVFEGEREIWTGLSQPINQVFFGVLVTDSPLGFYLLFHCLNNTLALICFLFVLFLPVPQTQTLT